MITDEVRKKAKELGIENIEDTIKIGSKEADDWNTILINAKNSLAQAKKTVELEEYIIPFIEKRIIEEVEKFQSKE